MQPSKFSANKTLRKHEKPRPPKWLVGSVALVQTARRPQSPTPQPPATPTQLDVGEDVLQRLEVLVRNLINDNIDPSTSTEILKMCHDLKTCGPTIEARNAVQLDRCFVELRNAAGNERFDPLCRLRLLEIIELRSMGWKGNENFENNYKNKLKEARSIDYYLPPTNSMCPVVPTSLTHDSVRSMQGSSVITSPSADCLSSSNNQAFVFGAIPTQQVSVLGPGEVMKSSGKYLNPIHIPMKNHFKDEVVIRNSDSGKVMGIKGRRVHMIEELSGTIVSFQRVVPGAKDRLVQLTGPTENAIKIGKSLIEETIRRNVSPIREMPNPIKISKSSSNLTMPMDRVERFGHETPVLAHSLSMNDANIGEYQYTVTVGHDSLKLSGPRLDLVKIGKLVLEEYFAGDAKRTSHQIDDDDADDDDDEDSSESFAELPPSNLKPVHSMAVLPKHDSFFNQTTTVVENSRPTIAEEVAEAELTERIVYDRNVLLHYALSPYSRATPRDLPKIIQEMPNILKKTPDFFDPEEFKNLDLSFTSMMTNEKYWIHRQGSIGSQDIDEAV